MSLFNLAAKITLDTKQYENGIEKAKKQIGGLSAFTFAKGQLIADGIKTAAKAVYALGKAAFESYANAEQLVGGVKTLFDHNADTVLENAQKAYKTVGMSANQYMETVTGFSASLIQSLGGDTAKAAKYADMALTDMSDNANKMGTNIESIKYAYQGFAKQNYTMLDNLKLGYGGTKSEMERLLQDAHKIDKSIGLDGSFGNIVKAIHVIQEKMKIAGTTSQEAADTISGSAGAVKAAWENLLTGIADKNADFDTLVDNFAQSVEVSAKNIVPRIKTIVKGIIKTFSELFPKFAEMGTQIIIDLAYGIIEGIPDLIPALVKVIVVMVKTLVENIDEIFYFTAEFIAALIIGIGNAFPEFTRWFEDLWHGFIDFFVDLAKGILDIGKKIVENIIEGVKKAWENFKKYMTDLWNGFVESFIDTVSNIKEIGKKIVENIQNGIKEAWEGLKNWFSGLWNSLFGTGSMNVNISANGMPVDGYHENGLSYVPKDGYRAILHKGERVLTAEENRRYSSGNTSSGVTIVQNISAVPQTAAEFAAASRAYLEGVRFA